MCTWMCMYAHAHKSHVYKRSVAPSTRHHHSALPTWGSALSSMSEPISVFCTTSVSLSDAIPHTRVCSWLALCSSPVLIMVTCKHLGQHLPRVEGSLFLFKGQTITWEERKRKKEPSHQEIWEQLVVLAKRAALSVNLENTAPVRVLNINSG